MCQHCRQEENEDEDEDEDGHGDGDGDGDCVGAGTRLWHEAIFIGSAHDLFKRLSFSQNNEWRSVFKRCV